MRKAEFYGLKIYTAMVKIPEALIPGIIANILRRYGRFGLAELVEKGWNWRRNDSEEVEGAAN